ncbi:MAG: SMC-Scp complex subunit ScpB [Planctomycetota bacterium]
MSDTAETVKDETEKAEPAADLGVLCPKVEAALLTSERALSSGKIAEAVGLEHSKPVNAAVAELNRQYEATGRAFRIEAVAGGWRVMTLPEHAGVLAELRRSKSQGKLSAAAMETLAIVAYKQPVLRAELESIRGVACGETLRSLMERHLVKIVGRAEELGRPMLYGTTKQFLEVFGLGSLKDLPESDVLRDPSGGKA